MKGHAQSVELLRPEVIEEIAAGEVIDRPASVAKELVENALDAGSSRIEVDAQGGGRVLLRVVDDGCGMTAGDAALSLQRHATSKLRAVDDLQRIATLGFRGEGLSSAAAVARLTLLTRRTEDTSGWRIDVEGGRQVGAAPAGCRAGTSVAVRDLFFNMPARSKFLRSTATELAHLQDVVQRAACGYPTVYFALRHEGRRLLELVAREDREQRARDVLANPSEGIFAGVAQRDGLGVEIYLSGATRGASSGRGLIVLINRRAVRDRALLQTIAHALGERLAARRYPAGVLYLDVDPARIDVNVHPQKQEVRFAEPALVHAAVRDAARAALDQPPRHVVDHGGDPARRYSLREAAMPATSDGQRSLPGLDRLARPEDRLRAAAERFWGAQRSSQAAEAPAAAIEGDYGLGAALRRFERAPLAPSNVAADPAERAPCRWLGWAPGDVLVGVYQGRLLLVERRAGWQWVQLRQLQRELDGGGVEQEALAAARELSFPGLTAELMLRLEDDLGRLGFSGEPFGPTVWLMRSVPRVLARAAALDGAETPVAEGVCTAATGVIENIVKQTRGAQPSVCEADVLSWIAAAAAQLVLLSAGEGMLESALEQANVVQAAWSVDLGPVATRERGCPALAIDLERVPRWSGR